jgi:hypothetical protein
MTLAIEVGAAQAQTGVASRPSAIPQARSVCGFHMKTGDHFDIVGLGTVDLDDTMKPLSPPGGPGSLAAVVCKRMSIGLEQHDDRSIRELAVPLYVGDATRTAVLIMVNGQFAFQVVEGHLSQAEVDQVNRQLNVFQVRQNELKARDPAKINGISRP